MKHDSHLSVDDRLDAIDGAVAVLIDHVAVISGAIGVIENEGNAGPDGKGAERIADVVADRIRELAHRRVSGHAFKMPREVGGTTPEDRLDRVEAIVERLDRDSQRAVAELNRRVGGLLDRVESAMEVVLDLTAHDQLVDRVHRLEVAVAPVSGATGTATDER